MTSELVRGLITFIVSGGFLALVTTLIKALRTRRSGVRALEREIFEDSAQDRRAARADARYWSAIAGRYARQLAHAGIDPDPSNPIPPSERSTPTNGDTPAATER